MAFYSIETLTLFLQLKTWHRDVCLKFSLFRQNVKLITIIILTNVLRFFLKEDYKHVNFRVSTVNNELSKYIK